MGESANANTSQNEDSTNQAKQGTRKAGDESNGGQVKINAVNKEMTVRGHMEIAKRFSGEEGLNMCRGHCELCKIPDVIYGR